MAVDPYNIGIQMRRNELTKTLKMISNWIFNIVWTKDNSKMMTFYLQCHSVINLIFIIAVQKAYLKNN